MHGAKYRHAAHACDVVMVNSRFTGDDVAATLGVDRDRIHVAYPGRRRGVHAGGPESRTATTCSRWERSSRARTSGTRSPRRSELGIELRVVGARGWGGVEAHGPATWLGSPSDDELPALYRGAAAFVYPSRFEGFGIPVLEAMACGTPCVVSSHPSLDEAAGDAAVRVDPDDVEAIAAGIERARSPSATRSRRAASRTHAGFTWLANGQRASGGVVAMKVAVDVTPLELTRAGTARYLGVAPAARRAEATVERLRGFSAGQGRHAVARPRVVPARAAAPREAAPTSCIARRTVARCAAASRSSSRSTTSPSSAARRRSRRGRGRTAASSSRASSAPRASSPRSPSSPRPRWRRCSRVPRERIRVVPNAAEARSPRTGRATTGDYVLAVGTLEPRKNLARSIEAAQRLGLELRVAGHGGLGRRRRVRPRRHVGRLRERRRSSRGSTAARLRRLPVALRGLRHPRARGDGVRRSRRHVARRLRRRRSRAAPRCSSTRRTSRRSPRASRRRSRAATSCARPGLRRARDYSWDESAKLLLDAYRDAAS